MAKKSTKQKKPFDLLTITDNYMFQAVMRNAERIRPLLEMVLAKKIKKIVFVETKRQRKPGTDREVFAVMSISKMMRTLCMM